MNLIDKLRDLIWLAEVEGSYCYVGSVAREAIAHIEKLEEKIRQYVDAFEDLV